MWQQDGCVSSEIVTTIVIWRYSMGRYKFEECLFGNRGSYEMAAIEDLVDIEVRNVRISEV